MNRQMTGESISYTHISNYGWQCPKCNRVYSPNIAECYYCNKKNITITSGYLNVKEENNKNN